MCTLPYLAPLPSRSCLHAHTCMRRLQAGKGCVSDSLASTQCLRMQHSVLVHCGLAPLRVAVVLSHRLSGVFAELCAPALHHMGSTTATYLMLISYCITAKDAQVDQPRLVAAVFLLPRLSSWCSVICRVANLACFGSTHCSRLVPTSGNQTCMFLTCSASFVVPCISAVMHGESSQVPPVLVSMEYPHPGCCMFCCACQPLAASILAQTGPHLCRGPGVTDPAKATLPCYVTVCAGGCGGCWGGCRLSSVYCTAVGSPTGTVQTRAMCGAACLRLFQARGYFTSCVARGLAFIESAHAYTYMGELHVSCRPGAGPARGHALSFSRDGGCCHVSTPTEGWVHRLLSAGCQDILAPCTQLPLAAVFQRCQLH